MSYMWSSVFARGQNTWIFIFSSHDMGFVYIHYVIQTQWCPTQGVCPTQGASTLCLSPLNHVTPMYFHMGLIPVVHAKTLSPRVKNDSISFKVLIVFSFPLWNQYQNNPPTDTYNKSPFKHEEGILWLHDLCSWRQTIPTEKKLLFSSCSVWFFLSAFCTHP